MNRFALNLPNGGSGGLWIVAVLATGVFAADTVIGPNSSFAILYLVPIVIAGRHGFARVAAIGSIALTGWGLWLRAGYTLNLAQITTALFAVIATVVVAGLLTTAKRRGEGATYPRTAGPVRQLHGYRAPIAVACRHAGEGGVL
jgi:uncharacterized membrane protein YoaK (UPF0700 family)